MEHCHNTVHEDNAMLLREIDDSGPPFLRPRSFEARDLAV
jgi:hypothetical protein